MHRTQRLRQTPPPWQGTEAIDSLPSAEKFRKQRRSAFGSNPHYEYALGTNLVLLTGTVTRDPVCRGSGSKQFVWFRMCVADQDSIGRRLFIPVRCTRLQGAFAWQNIVAGDQVAVVGQMWSARRSGSQFVYVHAERVSPNFPVLADIDPKYVRVRSDLWNRIAELMGGDDLPLIPNKRAEELLRRFAEERGIGDDEGVQDAAEDAAAKPPETP